jgi:hypothetical protein
MVQRTMDEPVSPLPSINGDRHLLRPSPTFHSFVAPCTPRTSMDLSALERSTILQMRDAMREEYMLLTESLSQAEEARRRLTTRNRYLEMWNKDLIGVLNDHGIEAPDAP